MDKNPKRVEKFPVASFDLTRPHDFSTVCKFAEAERENLLLAHFASSCGAASKARERPELQAFQILLDLFVVNHAQTGWQI